MQGVKMIGKSYRVVRALFQVHSYMYTQVCSDRNNYELQTAALYVYENEDPSQCLKMLKEKLDIREQESTCLIFPIHHIKEQLNDKNISLFFIQQYIMPLRNTQHRTFTVTEFLQILHGGLSSLNQLHMRDITHGNIALNTCYIMKQKNDNRCRFALNILDTNYFTEDDSRQTIDDRLFQSEGQTLGQTASFKDDLQSLVYVMTHLISKGKMLTVQRFQLEWITQTELLRWKNCEFFKQMIRIIPPELEILIEIYMIAKSLRRNQKPDYLKLIKKVLNVMAADRKRSPVNISKQPSLAARSSGLAKGMSNQSLSEDDINISIKGRKGQKCRQDEIKENDMQINR